MVGRESKIRDLGLVTKMIIPTCFFVTWICSGIAEMLFLLMSEIFCLHDEKKRKQAATYNQSNDRTYSRI